MISNSKQKFFSRYLPMILSVLLLVIAAFAYLTFKSGTPTAQAGWYSSGGTWLYRKPITIDHTRVNTATGTTTPLSNFPVVISVTDPDLKYTGSGGKVASSTGADILFTASDGTTLLNYEIESYSSSTGQTIAWVKIPLLTATSDYTIYEYFGNASAPANSGGNSQGTWDGNYKGVWHLPNGTTLTANDSTNNTNSGTLVGSPTAVATQIGGGASFSGGTSYISTANTLNIATPTISAWVKISSLPAARGSIAGFVEGNGSATADKDLSINTDGTVDWYVYDGSDRNLTSSVALSAGVWHYIVGVANGTTSTLYIDGLSVGTLSAGNTYTSYAAPGFEINGSYTGGIVSSYIADIVDEARVSNIARSSDWIATEYSNQSNPSTFYAYSSLQAQTRQSSGGTPAPNIKSRGGVKFR